MTHYMKIEADAAAPRLAKESTPHARLPWVVLQEPQRIVVHGAADEAVKGCGPVHRRHTKQRTEMVGQLANDRETIVSGRGDERVCEGLIIAQRRCAFRHRKTQSNEVVECQSLL